MYLRQENVVIYSCLFGSSFKLDNFELDKFKKVSGVLVQYDNTTGRSYYSLIFTWGNLHTKMTHQQIPR